VKHKNLNILVLPALFLGLIGFFSHIKYLIVQQTFLSVVIVALIFLYNLLIVFVRLPDERNIIDSFFSSTTPVLLVSFIYFILSVSAAFLGSLMQFVVAAFICYWGYGAATFDSQFISSNLIRLYIPILLINIHLSTWIIFSSLNAKKHSISLSIGALVIMLPLAGVLLLIYGQYPLQ
jgi:hypothetical protein